MTDPMPALREWAGEPVRRWTVEPLARGAVSDLVERITLVTAGGRELSVVRKRALPHEVAGLRAAQAVRAGAPAVPELIAAGADEAGPWLVMRFYAGTPLPGREAPAGLFVSLAHLHARFRDRPVPGVPRVDAAWWRDLCLSWVLPRVGAHGGPHPPAVLARAAALVTRLAEHPAAARTLAALPGTLLHGDVHPGNVIVHDGQTVLIDWGSARFGPAMLDLANLRADLATYTRTWTDLAGAPPDPVEMDLGLRWAAVQIPVQYLPWTVEHRDTAAVSAALDRAERALAEL